jgi:multidrug efflux pump subunit AcrA (membrane-fusion protein)
VKPLSRKTVHALVTLLPLLLLLPAGCKPQATATPPSGEGKTQDQVAAPPAVTLVKPVRKTLTHRIDQPGEIQAFEQTPMYAKISGYVAKVNKDIGDRVVEGEVLAELSVPELDEELSQKEALVVQARARVEQAKKLLGAAEAALLYADARVKEAVASRPRADADLQRSQSQYERLKTTTAVLAREVLEETRLGYEVARAAVIEVEAKIKSAEAAKAESEAKRATAGTDVSVAEANLGVAQTEQRRVAELVKYTKLRAPYPGVVTKRSIDPGHFLQSSASSGNKGEAAFVVARLDPVRIFVDTPENEAVLVKDEMRADVRVQALKGRLFKGAVKRSAWALDPKSRTLRTEIDLPNPDGRLRPGMYAFATITVEHANVFTVPASAVVTQGEQTFCYRVEGDKAVRMAVLTGLRDQHSVEVARKPKPGKDGEWEDFTGTEEIIANPAGVTDGQIVTISANP